MNIDFVDKTYVTGIYQSRSIQLLLGETVGSLVCSLCLYRGQHLSCVKKWSCGESEP